MHFSRRARYSPASTTAAAANLNLCVFNSSGVIYGVINRAIICSAGVKQGMKVGECRLTGVISSCRWIFWALNSLRCTRLLLRKTWPRVSDHRLRCRGMNTKLKDWVSHDIHEFWIIQISAKLTDRFHKIWIWYFLNILIVKKARFCIIFVSKMKMNRR